MDTTSKQIIKDAANSLGGVQTQSRATAELLIDLIEQLDDLVWDSPSGLTVEEWRKKLRG